LTLVGVVPIIPAAQEPNAYRVFARAPLLTRPHRRSLSGPEGDRRTRRHRIRLL
jgi:hypothetical protein